MNERRSIVRRISAVVLALVLAVTAVYSITARSHAPYRIEATYPHDSTAFTQGLVIADGQLYESTGRYGQSTLRRVDLATGRVLQQHNLPTNVFGEGLAAVGDRLIQLTWKEGMAYVYDRHTFALIDQFRYAGEGWGLAYDGTRLIMSDGTATLTVRDPGTFAELGRIEVRDANVPVTRLNELEVIDGQIWANVWQTDRIVVIDPATGVVQRELDLGRLLTDADRASADVFNGIAYDFKTGCVFVTGKLWPKIVMFDYDIRNQKFIDHLSIVLQR